MKFANPTLLLGIQRLVVNVGVADKNIVHKYALGRGWGGEAGVK